MACWVFGFFVERTYEVARRIKEARAYECGALQASAPYAGFFIVGIGHLMVYS